MSSTRPALCRLLAALCCATAFAAPATAQESAPVPAAQAVARQAFRAMEEQRWSDAAALVHPRALRLFHASEIRSARLRERAEGQVHRDPEMPDEVARWHEERSRRHLEEFGSPLQYQFGVGSLAELEALSPGELMARSLRSRDPREGMLRHLRAGGRPLPPDSLLWQTVPFPARTVVGGVVQDDSTVQVVYHTSLQPDTSLAALVKPALLTVRRSPDGWRLWSSEHDHDFLSEWSFGWAIGELDEEVEARLKEAQEKVVSWPAGEVPAGRAFVTGYPGGLKPPKSLVVEVPGRRGRTTRVEVPASAFGEVMQQLLMPWMGLEEMEPKGGEP